MIIKKLLSFYNKNEGRKLADFRQLFDKFQQILKSNNNVLKLFAELEGKLSGEYIFDINYTKDAVTSLSEETYRIISNLNILCDNKYIDLFSVHKTIQGKLETILTGKRNYPENRLIIPLSDIIRDDDDIVGGKNAILGEVKNRIQAPTPEGFAVTTKAYHDFMTYNDLWFKIANVYSPTGAVQENATHHNLEKDIETLFFTARFSPLLKKAFQKETKQLIKGFKPKQRLVVRSSAVGEDTLGKSYAGQFLSEINVRSSEILDAYKRVLSSRFRKLPYGADFSQESLEQEVPMAVGVQTLVNAKAAGVAYSLDPNNPSNNSILISSIYGLGTPVVSGTMKSDFFMVSRMDPTRILERKIVRKDKMVVPAADKGTEIVSVPTELRDKSSLLDDQIRQIAELAFIIERYCKRPQDIEWAIDETGHIVILQSRSLVIRKESKKHSETLPELLKHYKLLIKKQGQIANRGIAIGKVCAVTEDTDADDFPVGGIAVTHLASPWLTRFFSKAAAILTDVGSTTGHMATIAREFGIPAIVGMDNVTQVLHDGMEITIDAHENAIYSGIIHELLEYESIGKDVFLEMPEYVILRRILKNVAPLRLINPDSKEFVAVNCRSFHDIIRFAHEKAIHELINLNTSSRMFSGIASHDIELPIPLGLKGIDIGEGLINKESCSRKIGLESIGSLPMLALLEGLSLPNVWCTDPVKLDFSDFMSSLTRLSTVDARTDYQGQNLVVFSNVYMNLSLRLGYHYNVVDAYLSENINDNYIYFRFVGGVTESERRDRRAQTIRMILEQLNFKVLAQGDLVVGKIKKRSSMALRTILVQIGKLIGFTRQLDVQMTSDQSITQQFAKFFEKNQ